MARQKKSTDKTSRKRKAIVSESTHVKIPNNVLKSGSLHVEAPASYTMAVPYTGIIYATPSTATSTGYYYTPISSAGTVTVSSNTLFTVSPEKDRLEEEINSLKRDNSSLARDITSAKEAKQEYQEKAVQLEANVEELSNKQGLRYLLDRVNEEAQKKLLESDDFRKKFETLEAFAVIMAVDIRRSTELMLKAREPELYADFIISLCAGLRNIILENYGFFDKFTGDGILAFYPEILTGEDAPYRALKAADDCHKFFDDHYKAKRDCFNSVLMDIGLGIGIDYGKSHFVKIQDELTLIGSPVVYACRMSGADAGLTLLNHPAYRALSSKYSDYIDVQESMSPLKNEGNTLAYTAKLNKKSYKPKKPKW